MLKKLKKYNSPLVFSVILHLILMLIIVFSFSRSTKHEVHISVSILSQPEITQIYANKKQALNDQKKSHNQVKPETEGEDNNKLAKKDQEDKTKDSQKQSINDLSYSREIYQIGSRKNPTPSYPRIAKLRNYQGTVEICAISDAKGNVVNVEIHKSSGYSMLDKSALKTLKKWKFNIKNLADVNQNDDQFYRIIVPISFVLG